MENMVKTAIITGASRGIGAGLVEAFLKRGYNVVANSRNITTANPFAAAANVALVDGDIGQPGTRRGLWIPPYRDLAESMF
jgi:NAD(P)-dependent dehydrogenase (short-subunit alcohol dehydrogenase family)